MKDGFHPTEFDPHALTPPRFHLASQMSKERFNPPPFDVRPGWRLKNGSERLVLPGHAWAVPLLFMVLSR